MQTCQLRYLRDFYNPPFDDILLEVELELEVVAEVEVVDIEVEDFDLNLYLCSFIGAELFIIKNNTPAHTSCPGFADPPGGAQHESFIVFYLSLSYIFLL